MYKKKFYLRPCGNMKALTYINAILAVNLYLEFFTFLPM